VNLSGGKLLALVGAATFALGLAATAGARPVKSYWSELKAETRLHTGYRIASQEEIDELETEEAEARITAEQAVKRGADPTYIGEAMARAESAKQRLQAARRGYFPSVEICRGFGEARFIANRSAYRQFRCRGSIRTSLGPARVTLIMHVLSASGFRVADVRSN
jgi:hypothetical protein